MKQRQPEGIREFCSTFSKVRTPSEKGKIAFWTVGHLGRSFAQFRDEGGALLFLRRWGLKRGHLDTLDSLSHTCRTNRDNISRLNAVATPVFLFKFRRTVQGVQVSNTACLTRSLPCFRGAYYVDTFKIEVSKVSKKRPPSY